MTFLYRGNLYPFPVFPREDVIQLALPFAACIEQFKGIAGTRLSRSRYRGAILYSLTFMVSLWMVPLGCGRKAAEASRPNDITRLMLLLPELKLAGEGTDYPSAYGRRVC